MKTFLFPLGHKPNEKFHHGQILRSKYLWDLLNLFTECNYKLISLLKNVNQDIMFLHAVTLTNTLSVLSVYFTMEYPVMFMGNI